VEGRSTRAERAERAFEIPMLIAALLVIPAIVIEESTANESWRSLATILNWAIWLGFATELIVMLSVVPARRRWLMTHPLEVVIVVLTPPFVTGVLQSIRVLRLLRLVRLMKLAKHARRVFSLAGLRFAAVLAVLSALGGGAAFAELEGTTTWHGVYWAVATMTTVGSDFQPTRDPTRALALAMVLVGVSFVAILTGVIAQRFLAGEVEEVEAEIALLDVTEGDLLRQVQELGLQLRALETTLEQRARTTT
jgi:voltage-gated potassium channel